jgi:TorA maturation chaperone TorD
MMLEISETYKFISELKKYFSKIFMMNGKHLSPPFHSHRSHIYKKIF